MSRAKTLIRKLRLQPHPEGGHYREIHRAPAQVKTARGPRSAVTLIYFLLRRGERSLFHRVVSEEIWQHCEGAPLQLLRVSPDMEEKEAMVLGPLPLGRTARAAPVAVIPAGHWQAAESRGDYTLVACAVGPGFDFKDFLMLRDDAAASARLRKRYPGLGRFVG